MYCNLFMVALTTWQPVEFHCTVSSPFFLLEDYSPSFFLYHFGGVFSSPCCTTTTTASSSNSSNSSSSNTGRKRGRWSIGAVSQLPSSPRCAQMALLIGGWSLTQDGSFSCQRESWAHWKGRGAAREGVWKRGSGQEIHHTHTHTHTLYNVQDVSDKQILILYLCISFERSRSRQIDLGLNWGCHWDIL